MKSLIIVALLATGALALGQGNMMPSFSDFDMDGDSKISQSEFESAQQERMATMAESGKMMRNAGNAPLFSSFDTNDDGFIDSDEFSAKQSANKRGQGMGRGQGGGQGMYR